MAEYQNFRSALNGFNREDVVRYIEYLLKRHASEVSQMKNELLAMQAQLDAAQKAPDLSGALEEANARCAALEAELAALRSREPDPSSQELEAYRRAERAESAANRRVSRLYEQANGILADATAKSDEASARVSAAADQASAQIAQLQAAVAASRGVLQEAAASLYALRPMEDGQE